MAFVSAPLKKFSSFLPSSLDETAKLLGERTLLGEVLQSRVGQLAQLGLFLVPGIELAEIDLLSGLVDGRVVDSVHREQLGFRGWEILLEGKPHWQLVSIHLEVKSEVDRHRTVLGERVVHDRRLWSEVLELFLEIRRPDVRISDYKVLRWFAWAWFMFWLTADLPAKKVCLGAKEFPAPN